MDIIFGGREVLDDDQFYSRFFGGKDISKEIAVGVRRSFIENLPLDMARLHPSDSFKDELNFVWGYDSLADVEIVCAIERRFAIKITEGEAKQAGSLGDLVGLVHAKLHPPAPKNASEPTRSAS